MRPVLRRALAAILTAGLPVNALADNSAAAPDPPAASVTASVTATDAARATLDTVPAVTAPALRERLGQADRVPGLVILDVRTAEEYAAGHIRGARNISHDQLVDRLAELADARDQDVLVYCRSGRRAASAIETLRAAGYTNLSHLEGDFQGWQALMAPVATTTPPSAAPHAPKGAGQ